MILHHLTHAVWHCLMHVGCDVRCVQFSGADYVHLLTTGFDPRSLNACDPATCWPSGISAHTQYAICVRLERRTGIGDA